MFLVYINITSIYLYHYIFLQMSLILVSSNKIFNGFQKVFKHASTTLQKEATFAIYLPEAKSKVRSSTTICI